MTKSGQPVPPVLMLPEARGSSIWKAKSFNVTAERIVNEVKSKNVFLACAQQIKRLAELSIDGGNQ